MQFSDLIPSDFLTDEKFLARLRQAAAFGMMSLFTDMEKARRIEVSRLQGGVLLGDILMIKLSRNLQKYSILGTKT